MRKDLRVSMQNSESVEQLEVRLIKKYSPYLTRFATQLADGLKDATFRESLIQAGMIALLSAMRKHVNQKKNNIETLARTEIKRAILNEVKQRPELKHRFKKESDLPFFASEEEMNLHRALVASKEHRPELILLRKNIASIEAKQEKYPLVSMTEAALVMGITNRSNASKEIKKAELAKDLFTVEFFNGTKRVPLFQIDQTRKKVYPIIKDLLSALTDDWDQDAESWLLYDWFTSPIDDDSDLTPADLLHKREAFDELLYLAGQAGAENAGRYAL
ncbi:hypothetical protein [Agaribacter flavus]|uniref:Uncharacterized protein n=1 Tax=Agaribacter flavus TaxID=1902781 RepID=A0ABV7FMD0_9ALTE